MFGNPSAERTAIEMTYEDTATIYRTAPQTGADGLTQAVLAEVYQGIVCGLSRTRRGRQRPDQGAEQRGL